MSVETTRLLTSLRLITQAATPGRWGHNPARMWLSPDGSAPDEFVGAGPGGERTCVAATGPADDEQSMADAAFIAAFDPPTATCLLDAVEAVLALPEDASAADAHALVLSALRREDFIAGRAHDGSRR